MEFQELKSEQIAALTAEDQAAYYKQLAEKNQQNYTEAYKAYNEEKAAHNSTVEKAKETISDLSKQVATSTKVAAAGGLTVTVDKENYRIIGKKFHVSTPNGFKLVTAEELVKDEALMRKLIKADSHIFQKVS